MKTYNMTIVWMGQATKERLSCDLKVSLPKAEILRPCIVQLPVLMLRATARQQKIAQLSSTLDILPSYLACSGQVSSQEAVQAAAMIESIVMALQIHWYQPNNQAPVIILHAC